MKEIRVVRWLMSMWCNYKCWYCRQDHRRDSTFGPADAVWSDADSGARPTGRAHWADNRSPLEWLSAFKDRFYAYRTVFTLTGGEPMLDLKNMSVLLPGLLCEDYVEAVRIDTNGSWDPTKYPHLNKSKVRLMVSYHPTEIAEGAFLSRLDALCTHGWNVVSVNLVVQPEMAEGLTRLASAVYPAVLSPQLAYGSQQYYTPEQLACIRTLTPDADWYFRTGGPTRGTRCMYPAVAYEINPDGSLEVGCHPRVGNLFDGPLPELLEAPAVCPMNKCTCTDRYSYNERVGVDGPLLPIDAYAERRLA